MHKKLDIHEFPNPVVIKMKVHLNNNKREVVLTMFDATETNRVLESKKCQSIVVFYFIIQ